MGGPDLIRCKPLEKRDWALSEGKESSGLEEVSYNIVRGSHSKEL